MSGSMNHEQRPDRARVAQEIVAAHGLRFGAATSAPATAIAYSADDAIYRGARQACGALGFIDIDAEC